MGWATNSRGVLTALANADAEMSPAHRFIDLAVRFRIKDGPLAGSITRPYGGTWDRELGGYCTIWKPGKGWVGGQSPKARTIWVAAQSVEFIQDWVSRVVFALGGRRSGKTTGSLAPKLIVLMLCMPGKPGGVLSPTYRQSNNVWKALRRHTPRDWWADLRRADRLMIMVNGSSVVLLSADRPGSSRSEGVAWLAWDEKQDISDEASANSMLSMSEGGGHAQIIETGTVKPSLRAHSNALMASARAKVYVMRSRGNPFIKHDIFDLAEEFLDAATIEAELEGRWPDLQGRCYYCFDEAKHARTRAMVRAEDTTEIYCLGRFEERAQYLIGVDPPGAAVICRLYDREVLHVEREIVIAPGQGDVRDLARACRKAIGAADALVVSDPHETRWDKDVKKYFRQFSMRMLSVRRVEREYRLTAVRARIERLQLLVDPVCRHLLESLDLQQYINGEPDKGTMSKLTPGVTLDHIVDALGYLIYRIWPPPRREDYELSEQEVAA